jgi:membrane protease YdiL (CAAX protease family)
MNERRLQSLPLLGFGLGLAFVLFGLTFRGPRYRFWQQMTRTGLLLGGLALATEPELRRTRIRPADVAAGLASAGMLYVIFQIGDRLARLIMPQGGAEIEAIYSLKKLRPRPELMARLGFIIGPAEELFWRGFIQERLMRHLGRLKGTILGAAAYGGAHLVSGNSTLIGAASIAGACWGGLFGLGMPLGALIVSHVVWDIVIFLIAPTMPLSEETVT